MRPPRLFPNNPVTAGYVDRTLRPLGSYCKPSIPHRSILGRRGHSQRVFLGMFPLHGGCGAGMSRSSSQEDAEAPVFDYEWEPHRVEQVFASEVSYNGHGTPQQQMEVFPLVSLHQKGALHKTPHLDVRLVSVEGALGTNQSWLFDFPKETTRSWFKATFPDICQFPCRATRDGRNNNQASDFQSPRRNPQQPSITRIFH